MIGPAGENRVVFACIKHEKYRSLGRGGMGAVLREEELRYMLKEYNTIRRSREERE